MSGASKYPPDAKWVHFDQCEMALMIAEAVSGHKRRGGVSAAECLSLMPEAMCDGFMDAAERVYRYILEQMNASGVLVDIPWDNKRDKRVH